MDGMQEFFRQGYSRFDGDGNDMQLDFPSNEIVEVSINADGQNMFDMMAGSCCDCCKHGKPCEEEKKSPFANVQIDIPDNNL
jgi:hypothetical protein